MYHRLVGGLIPHTKTDIAYFKRMYQGRAPYLQATKRIQHYLKYYSGKGILFKENNTLALEAYFNIDYANSLGSQRPIQGFIIM